MAIPDDVLLKLDHARHHLQTLNAQYGDFGDRNPYEAITEVHPEPGGIEGWGYLRMKVNRDPRREWSLTIGDCVHNLRSALDYAALALWRAHSGEPGDTEVEQIMFPIYSSQRKYRVNRRRKIGGVHPGAMRAIRLMQPYQRRDDPDGHPLAILNALDVYDKHRFLHTTHDVIQGSEVEILERKNVVISQQPTVRIGGFVDGDVIASFRLMATGKYPKLNVKLKTTYGVAFDKEGPGRGLPVRETLNDVREFIRDAVLVALEPYF